MRWRRPRPGPSATATSIRRLVTAKRAARISRADTAAKTGTPRHSVRRPWPRWNPLPHPQPKLTRRFSPRGYVRHPHPPPQQPKPLRRHQNRYSPCGKTFSPRLPRPPPSSRLTDEIDLPATHRILRLIGDGSGIGVRPNEGDVSEHPGGQWLLQHESRSVGPQWRPGSA